MDNSINYEQFAQAVKERKESSPELRNAPHKEIISSVLREHYVPQKQGENTMSPISTAETKQEKDLPSYARAAPAEAKRQAEELIDYTLEHGISAGVAKAIKNDPFVLDLFHDALVEKLHEELRARKLLS